MAHALALDSRDIALDLHRLLRDLDPARWQDEVETAVRKRLGEIEQQISSIQTRYGQLKEIYTDDTLTALNDRLDSLSALVQEHAPASGLSMPDLRRQWMDFRDQAQPAYENLADSLRLARIHVPSLRPTNYVRNVFHVTMALMCLLLVEYVMTAGWMMVGAFSAAVAAWSMELGKRRHARVDRITWKILGRMGHPYERKRINSATWFSTALFALSLTGSHLVCGLALIVLGLADPAEGLFGRRFGRIKLIHGRSLEGTTAFVLVGALGCLAVLSLWHPGLGWGLMLALTAGAVLPAALAELIAHRIDDNLLVPAASAAGVIGVALLVGVPF